MSKLYIYESFYSLQGEGKRVGNPSVFLRFCGCNLKCQGFKVIYLNPITKHLESGCDSYYSVDTSFKKDWKEIGDTNELLRLINTHIPQKLQTQKNKLDIVITGGEPLIHWKNEIFQMSLKHLIEKGHHVTIETNGSIAISIDKEYQKSIQFSISPKLSISGEKYEKRININAIEYLLSNTPDSYLKFVLSSKKDLEEIEQLIKDKDNWNDKIYFMPLATSSTLDNNGRIVSQLAVENGFKYTDRIHIRLYGDKQGV